MENALDLAFGSRSFEDTHYDRTAVASEVKVKTLEEVEEENRRNGKQTRAFIKCKFR